MPQSLTVNLHLFVDLGGHPDVGRLHVGLRGARDAALQHLLYPGDQVDLRVRLRHRVHSLKYIATCTVHSLKCTEREGKSCTTELQRFIS